MKKQRKTLYDHSPSVFPCTRKHAYTIFARLPSVSSLVSFLQFIKIFLCVLVYGSQARISRFSPSKCLAATFPRNLINLSTMCNDAETAEILETSLTAMIAKAPRTKTTNGGAGTTKSSFGATTTEVSGARTTLETPIT